jgi:hypothetical protein
MKYIELEVSEIPHGHGLSFKRGVADGLLNCQDHEDMPHKTHTASYQRGVAIGIELRSKIALEVKD